MSRCCFAELSSRPLTLHVSFHVYLTRSLSVSPSFSRLHFLLYASPCSCNCLLSLSLSSFLSQSPASSCNSSCLTLFVLSQCETGHLLSCNERSNVWGALTTFKFPILFISTLTFSIAGKCADKHKKNCSLLLQYLFAVVCLHCGNHPWAKI